MTGFLKFHLVDGTWNHGTNMGTVRGVKKWTRVISFYIFEKKMAETGYRLLGFFSLGRIGIFNAKNRNRHRNNSSNRKCKLTLKQDCIPVGCVPPAR